MSTYCATSYSSSRQTDDDNDDGDTDDEVRGRGSGVSGSLGVNVVVVEVIERKVDVVVGSVRVLVASAICPSPPDDAEVLTTACMAPLT